MNRLKHGSAGIAAAISLALILATSAVGFLSCSTDQTPVETSVGVRPAGEVKTIDQVADVLAALRDTQNAAVKAHDAKFGQEPADVHSKKSKLLTDTGMALKASIRLLAAIKRGETAGSPLNALGPMMQLGRPFLALAVDLGVISQQTADTLKTFFPEPHVRWIKHKTKSGVIVARLK